MIVDKAIVILRHNTSLGGDVRLAAREFDALVGKTGRPLLNRRDLLSALGGSRAAHVPELSSNPSFVAVAWEAVEAEGLTRLLRYSAFAQELFLIDADTSVYRSFADANPAITTELLDITGGVQVAMAWNYIIESEGVLEASAPEGRVRRTIDLVTDPYLSSRSSNASAKMRRAKKTTLSLSHDLHIYKAKFFPRMVRALLNVFDLDSAPVFDPFCGSGTALLEASLLGRDSAGVDIDPICRLISRTKVEPFRNPKELLRDLAQFEAALSKPMPRKNAFVFPAELTAKLTRRDRIDGTQFLPEITAEAEKVAVALSTLPLSAVNRDLLSVLASDAVTKKIRYRFIGIGNGKYTIEIIKQPILGRLKEKIERCRQLAYVFTELQELLGLKLGRVEVSDGDARLAPTWPAIREDAAIITSPPYLPASSGREHYASSRALAFAVLGFNPGDHGYFDVGDETAVDEKLDACPEARRLMEYLYSDQSDTADPQRDAMRFLRKAVPTQQYLRDIKLFFANVELVLGPKAALMLVVAQQHTFYSHRRQEVEHVVSGANLYGEIAGSVGLRLSEEIPMELLKSSASRARPRAKDDYYESVLVMRPEAVAVPEAVRAPKKRVREKKDVANEAA